MGLRPYYIDDLPKLKEFRLHKEQHSLTLMPVDSLALCNNDPSRHAIVLEEDGEIVTFFVLHEKEGVAPYSTASDAILLRAFATNAIHQGKGFGKNTLQSLPAYINEYFPNINIIYLTVYLFNERARMLYQKIGFTDTGAREIRSGGELMVMKWSIS